MQMHHTSTALSAVGCTDCFKHMQIPKHKTLADLTRRVSEPPTMLRPRPRFPLQISMVHSLPARTGQRRGSEVVSADSK